MLSLAQNCNNISIIAKNTEDLYYMSEKYLRCVENGTNWYNGGEMVLVCKMPFCGNSEVKSVSLNLSVIFTPNISV